MKSCCPACAEAARITGKDEHDVLNRPWLGRPPHQLLTGDVVRSFGRGPHVLGDVTVVGSRPFVQWRDRDTREELKGGIVYTLIQRTPPADGMAVLRELLTIKGF